LSGFALNIRRVITSISDAASHLPVFGFLRQDCRISSTCAVRATAEFEECFVNVGATLPGAASLGSRLGKVRWVVEHTRAPGCITLRRVQRSAALDQRRERPHFC